MTRAQYKHLVPSLKAIVRPALSRDKSDLLMLLVACVLVLLPHLQHVSAAIATAVLLLLGWRGWIAFSGRRLPPRWLLLPIAAVAMGCVWFTYHTLLGRDAGVGMLTFLLVLKLLEMHAKRDMFVVLYLSFFLMLTNFFYSQTIGTAVLMTLALLALLTAHISFQYVAVVPPLKKRLRLAGMMMGLAVPLMLVLFFLFPRIQGPLWGLPGDANSGRSGLSDSMTPGTVSDLALSDDIAFRAKFDGPVPAPARLYWRAIVLGQYDGRTWTQNEARGLPAGSVQAVPASTPTHYEITLEPTGRRWLYALDVPVAMPSIAGQRVGWTNMFELISSQPINERLRYQVTSWTDFKLQPIASPDDITEGLQRPTGFNPATNDFAQQLMRQSTDSATLIRLVLDYFRREPFRYTLEPPLLGRNSVDDFLFTTRAGFCEHFAGAFVVIMRELGIPARVVTGYQGGELNTVDGYLEVRQSDAHAWAEVWLEQRGWVRVDPTAAVAPERIERKAVLRPPRGFFGGLIGLTPSRTAWLPKLRLNLDAMANSWNQWVLGYSPKRQQNLIALLGFGQVDWQVLTGLMFGAGSLVMGLSMIPLLMRRQIITPIERLYRQFGARMARYGLHHVTDEGPQTFRNRVAAHNTLSAAKKEAAIGFLQQYEQLQYGRVDAVAQKTIFNQLKALLAACR